MFYILHCQNRIESVILLVIEFNRMNQTNLHHSKII